MYFHFLPTISTECSVSIKFGEILGSGEEHEEETMQWIFNIFLLSSL